MLEKIEFKNTVASCVEAREFIGKPYEPIGFRRINGAFQPVLVVPTQIGDLDAYPGDTIVKHEDGSFTVEAGE